MDGILVINKPEGMTSHDVISRLRRKYGQKKFGHAGTLDPMASGVLVILAGKAAKLLQFLPDTDKEYIATVQLGKSYDTDDIWGQPTAEREISRDFDFQNELNRFKGKLHQKVPAVSAKKVNGKKLMEYQRSDQPVPDVYSDVEVYDIHPLDKDSLKFQVSCSSGTYIRSICRDLGENTGNLAAMSSLVRTKACGFDLSQAEDLDKDEHTVHDMAEILSFLPVCEFDPVSDIYNGKSVHIDTPHDRLLMTDQGRPIAIYDRHHKDVFSCTRGGF
ncbi:MAG: tRNA pseudouridine(55) synthase TruB [Erysipelotrichaceae bacterium]|nr:tRNA pseudouridine(55) synthase TruB [Erysipelotrichaceae bacterium]